LKSRGRLLATTDWWWELVGQKGNWEVEVLSSQKKNSTHRQECKSKIAKEKAKPVQKKGMRGRERELQGLKIRCLRSGNPRRCGVSGKGGKGKLKKEKRRTHERRRSEKTKLTGKKSFFLHASLLESKILSAKGGEKKVEE